MSHRRHTQNYPHFTSLSARRQRDEFIRLRWKILRDTPVYGGMFTSHQVLDEPGRPALYNQWFDFLFLGLDGRTIWNAEIITARKDFWDTADTIAWDRATALMSETEREEEFRMDFDPIFVGGQKMYRLQQTEKRRYPAFGDLTFREYEEQLKASIIDNEPPAVHERFQTDRKYRYGIGVKLVIDAEEINQAVVEAAIERFRAEGEADWTAAAPVPRERLPVETEDAALAAVKENRRTTSIGQRPRGGVAFGQAFVGAADGAKSFASET